MKYNSEVSFVILILIQLKGIGATFIKKNLGVINYRNRWSDSNISRSVTNLLSLVGKKYSSLDIQEAILKAEEILCECELYKIGLISIAEESYPQKLFEIKDPPPVLFFIGDLSLLQIDTVTVIGTRKPNDNGKIIAERVGKYFASKGWAICNGLANGIDTFSILDQKNFCFAKVIGIVGSGLTKSSLHSLSKQSAINIDSILSTGGLVLSEMPPSKKQDTFSVVKSCRIQAGIGAGLILVQSSISGGSQFTVKAAVDANRPLGIVYPVKSDINSDDYTANKQIIERGILGLSEFVSLKKSNFPRSKIIILSSRDSYPEFEAELKKNSNTPTLITQELLLT